MGDLPEVNKGRGRIEITEDDLSEGRAQRPSRPPAPPAGAKSPGPSPPALAGPAATDSRTPVKDVALDRTGHAAAAYCRGCGRPLHPEAMVCPHCGVAASGATQAAGAAMAVALSSKSSGIAILASLLFTGAGHWYVGRIGRGFAFLFAAVVSWVLIAALVGFFLLPIVYIWAAIDARKCAQEHNALLMAQVGIHAPTMLNG